MTQQSSSQSPLGKDGYSRVAELLLQSGVDLAERQRLVLALEQHIQDLSSQIPTAEELGKRTVSQEGGKYLVALQDHQMTSLEGLLDKERASVQGSVNQIGATTRWILETNLKGVVEEYRHSYARQVNTRTPAKITAQQHFVNQLVPSDQKPFVAFVDAVDAIQRIPLDSSNITGQLIRVFGNCLEVAAKEEPSSFSAGNRRSLGTALRQIQAVSAVVPALAEGKS